MNLKKLNKKKIIINGSNSFIAKSIKANLEKKYNCIYFDRNTNLKDKKLINLYKDKIYAILNLSFITPRDKNLSQHIIINKNIKLTKKIISFSKIVSPKKFINFSSMAVYSEKSGNYDELSPTNCEDNKDSIYGISKLISEKIISSMLIDTNIQILHLRISQVYGPKLNIMRIIPQMILELKNYNTITVFNQGERVSNFTNIIFLLKVLNFFLIKKYFGIYNIGEENISYKKLAKKIIKIYGNSTSKILYKSNEILTNKFYLNTKKLIKIIKNEKK